MSYEAVNHVMQLQMDRSSDKFVLLCLSNYADERGTTYPSQMRLLINTCMDRKTLILSLKRLEEYGYIQDTNHRCGSTKQVVVYRILGIPSCSTCHYVYKITDPATGEYYIGKRSFVGDPAADPYRGSGEWPKHARAQGRTLVKEILSVVDSSEAAIVEERAFQRRADADPLCRNIELPSRLRARNMHNFGTLSDEVERVPKFHGKGPNFPPEQSQNSLETVPKTGPRTLLEPLDEPSEEEIRPIAPEKLPASAADRPLTKRERQRLSPTKWQNDAEFLGFYHAYPRSDAPAKAWEAWKKALTKVSAADIMHGLAAYRFNSDPQYQPMPATWLNQERWTPVEIREPPAPPAKPKQPFPLFGHHGDPGAPQMSGST
jgi:hypothetical protein